MADALTDVARLDQARSVKQLADQVRNAAMVISGADANLQAIVAAWAAKAEDAAAKDYLKA